MKTRSKRRMKLTVSETDNQGDCHVSQPSTSPEAKFDVCPVTTPTWHIIYTTAELHENLIKINTSGIMNIIRILFFRLNTYLGFKFFCLYRFLVFNNFWFSVSPLFCFEIFTVLQHLFLTVLTKIYRESLIFFIFY